MWCAERTAHNHMYTHVGTHVYVCMYIYICRDYRNVFVKQCEALSNALKAPSIHVSPLLVPSQELTQGEPTQTLLEAYWGALLVRVGSPWVGS